MLEKETAQVMYLLVAIQSAQSQTKISSLKKLLSELQKIPCGSESLRRLVITKGSFERSRQFLHLCVSSKTTLPQSLSVLLKRKIKPNKKSNSKNTNTPTEYHQSRTNLGFPTQAANVRPQPACIKSNSPE